MDRTHADRVEAELGASVRRFHSVRAALSWYVEQRARRTGRAIDLEAVGSPANDEYRNQREATFARIAACLVDRHEADEPDEHLGAEHEARVGMLCAWYASARAQQRLADEFGLSLRALERWMSGVERILRRRLRSAGVVEEWSV